MRPHLTWPALLALISLGVVAQDKTVPTRPAAGTRRVMPVPDTPVTDDAEEREEAHRWKTGGDPTFADLSARQGLAAREVARWGHLLPQPGGRRPGLTATTALTWTPIGPTALYGYSPSSTDWNSGRPTAILTHPTDANTLYVAISGGGVWKSTNADLASSGDWTWTNITDALPATSTEGNIAVGDLAMDPSDSSKLYLGMGDPLSVKATGFFYSTDAGATWSQGGSLGGSTSVIRILAPSANTLVVATDERGHGLYRSTDGGQTFTAVDLISSDSNLFVKSITAFSSTDLAAAALTYDYGVSAWVPKYYYSSNAGQTWTAATFSRTFTDPSDSTSHTVYPFGMNIVAGPGGKGYALVADGTSSKLAKGLYVTTDKGATWTFQGATTLWSLSSDGGQTTYNLMLAVDPDDASKVFAGANLASYRSTDGGATWEQMTHWYGNQRVYAHADFHVASWSKTGTKALYIGNDGGLAILRDPYRATIPSGSGSVSSDPTFLDHRRNKGLQTHLQYTIASTCASSPTDSTDRVIFGMQDNSTGVRKNTGSGLSASTTYYYVGTGDGMGVALHPQNGQKALVASYYNSYSYTSNLSSSGTASWSSSSTGGSGAFYTPIAIVGSDSSGNSVVTANANTVYTSSDFGATWTALSMTGTGSGLSIKRVAASPSQSGTYAITASITGNSATGYYTSNSGTSWTQFGSFTGNSGGMWGISIGATPTTLYAASTSTSTSAHHIWKSTDSGATWSSIDGSSGSSNGYPFGIPAQFVRESVTSSSTLYAGTDFGLYRSTDSGATWSRFGSGLPMVQVQDMYESPHSGFIRVATYGRGAWEIKMPVSVGISPTSVSMAAGGTQSFTATVSGSETLTVSWSASGGSVNSSGLFTAPATGGDYTVTATSNDDSSKTASATVHVVDVTITADGAVTTGTTGHVASVPSLSGATYAWTISGGTITAGQGTRQITWTAGSTGTATLGVTVTPSGGSGVSNSANVTVAAVPVATITATSPVLTGTTGLTASVANQSGMTYAWTVSGGTITAGQGTRQVTYTAGAGGTATITCTVTNAAGTQTVGTKKVGVSAELSTIWPSATTVTTGATNLTAQVVAQAGTTYAWTISGGTITNGQGTYTVRITAGAAGTLTLGCTVTPSGGSASVGSKNITVLPVPVATITADSPVLASTTGLTASVPSQTSSTYTWTLSGGTITAGQGTRQITWTSGAAGTATLGCTVKNAAGTSTVGSRNVTVTDSPSTIGADTYATTGVAGYTAAVPSQAGATYAWAATGGTITAGQGTYKITYTPGAVGTLNLSCTVTPSGGSPSLGSKDVTVVAAPVSTVTATTPVLTGTSGLTASVPSQSGATYAWTVSGGTITAGQGTQAITWTAGSAGTATITCVVTNAAGTASTGTKKVGVSAELSTIWPSATSISAGGAIYAYVVQQSGATYNWGVANGTITSGQGTATVRVTAGTAGTMTLTCTVTPSGGSASMGIKYITVN